MFLARKSRTRRAVFVAHALLAVGIGGVAGAAPTAEVADAAMRGDRDQLLALLEHGADANEAQGDGMTALHWAVMNEDVEAARSLIYAGANVHATTRLNAVTPLWLAAQSGGAVMVYMLLDNKAEADAANGDGVTPLDDRIGVRQSRCRAGAGGTRREPERSGEGLRPDAVDVRGGEQRGRRDRGARREGRRRRGGDEDADVIDERPDGRPHRAALRGAAGKR